MNYPELKLEMIDWILKDNNLNHLQDVHALMNRLNKNLQDSERIIGFTPNGSKVSKKMLIERIKDSIADIEAGRLIEGEKFEHDSEQW